MRDENHSQRVDGEIIAQPSSAASSGGVPQPGPDRFRWDSNSTGAETVPQLAGKDVCRYADGRILAPPQFGRADLLVCPDFNDG